MRASYPAVSVFLILSNTRRFVAAGISSAFPDHMETSLTGLSSVAMYTDSVMRKRKKVPSALPLKLHSGEPRMEIVYDSDAVSA